MFGKVYVIEFENGLVKIGSSKNVKQRIRNIETGSCNKAVKIYTTENCFNYRSVEVELLRTFKSKRRLGEYVNSNFDYVVDQLCNIKLEIYSKEIHEKIKNRQDEAIKSVIKTFSDHYNCDQKENKSVHCSFCLIPIEEFVENKTLNCEDYSNLMDIKDLFCSENQFYDCGYIELYTKKQIDEFKNIQIDLGDWY